MNAKCDNRMKTIHKVLELDTLGENECLTAPGWEDPKDPLAHCILREDLQQIAEIFYKDGYDVRGFEIREIPHPSVLIFYREKSQETFLAIKEDKTWQIGYHRLVDNGAVAEVAQSIAEAIEKYEWE